MLILGSSGRRGEQMAHTCAIAWLQRLTNVGIAPGFFLTRPKAALGSRAKRDKAC